MAGIGETAGMIGHDIRNPLQTITGSVYLAKEEIQNMPESDGKKSMQESVNLIEQQTEYISKIVADLQDYARPLCPEIKEYNVEEIVQSALSNSKIPSNIQVTTQIPQQLPKVSSDKTYLQRALVNLFTNSSQAMPKGGKLTIAATQKDRK